MNVVFSVISHGQRELVQQLLSSMDEYLICEHHNFQIVITLNLPEEDRFRSRFKLKTIQNSNTKGFGSNQNSVFQQEKPDIFLIVNPDIKFNSLFNLDKIIYDFCSSGVSISSPVIVNNTNEIEDYKRSNLSLLNLIKRNILNTTEKNFDWYAGMFLIVSGKSFSKLKGFDERFYMYVEDCDLCVRAKRLGMLVQDVTEKRVLHDARRSSRKSIRYLIWHISSILKYWWKSFKN